MAAFERYALVLVFLALVVFFSLFPLTSTTFLTGPNARNIAGNESVVALAALAAMIPLVCGQFDVSMGAVLGLSSVIVAELTTVAGLTLPVALVAGLLAGVAVGLINGFLIAYLNANSLVITLGMATLLGGLGALWSGNNTLLGIPTVMTSFGNTDILGVPKPAWVMVVVAAAVAYVMRFTVFGRHLVSIGANPAAAKLVGMPVERTVLLSFAASSIISAISGVLLLSRTGAATAGVGDGYTLPALAAVFLGSTTIRPGQFTVAGALIGVFFVAVTVNGLTIAGAANWVEPVFNGTAVVVAVSASALLVKRRRGGARM